MPPPSLIHLMSVPDGNIPRDPHQEHQHHAEREREAQVVVRVLGPLRPAREHLRPEQRRQQLPAERDVETRQGKHDEAARRHPMHEALERIEAHQRAARPPVLDAHHAADQIEQDQHRQHAEDGDGGDPAQRHLMELAPVAAGGLLQHARPGVRKRAAPLDLLQLLQKLPLLDRLRHRIDFGRLLCCCAMAGAVNAAARHSARAAIRNRSGARIVAIPSSPYVSASRRWRSDRGDRLVPAASSNRPQDAIVSR